MGLPTGTVAEGEVLHLKGSLRSEGRHFVDSRPIKGAERQTQDLTQVGKLHFLIQFGVSDRHRLVKNSFGATIGFDS
jgi:hypothetical protein